MPIDTCTAGVNDRTHRSLCVLLWKFSEQNHDAAPKFLYVLHLTLSQNTMPVGQGSLGAVA